MTFTLVRTPEYVQVEAVIDLENGTWTCTAHGTSMDIAGGAECPECMNSWHAPPDASSLEATV